MSGTTLNFEPADRPMRARAGSTIAFDLQFKDEAGDPLDVTGRTWAGEIDDADGVDAATWSFDLAGAAAGTVVASVVMPAVAGAYTYDIWESTGATVMPLMTGHLTVTAMVT